MTPKDFLNKLPDWPPLNPQRALWTNRETQDALSRWMADYTEEALPLGTVPLTPEGLQRHADSMVDLVERAFPEIREVIAVINAQERQILRLLGAQA